MKIILSKKCREKIFSNLKKNYPNETKGALFAENIENLIYLIDDVYFEKNVGNEITVTLFNNEEYKKFQENYHQKNKNDYKKHNYIGDWHSHPQFELYPSFYDISQVKLDLKNSNANFLIQIIFKIKKDKLIGNAFFYNKKLTAIQVELIIE